MQMEKVRIAVDGPSGAGKSTIAKMVAKRLGIDYIDTGAMYRAVAYKILSENIALTDLESLKEMLSRTEVDLSGGKVILDGNELGERIRTPEVTAMASDCSALPVVREKLVSLQREMAEKKSVIMDGRDIGTNVLKDAEKKFFLTASADERALRRYREFQEKGQDMPFEQVKADIVERDHNDSTRALNPLAKAPDAVEIDSTSMDIDEVVEVILEQVKK